MTLADHQRLRPDLVWTGKGFESGWTVEVGAVGRIVSAGPDAASKSDGEANPFATDVDLKGKALLPGFVNAHSHAFQRGLRGLGESFPRGAGSFWTWREAMYSLVGRLDEELLYELSSRAFREMLAAGITTVGEFHYVHHLHDVTRSFAGDAVVLQSARDVGIRIVLLQAFYRFGGLDSPKKGKPLAGGQLRFETPDFDVYVQSLERLESLLRGDASEGLCRLGVVAHSIRAVSEDDLRRLHALSKERGWVFHMHVEEQRQEIEDSVEVYGKTPMQVILDACEADERTTAVHCTHTAPADMKRYLATGANVCLCPLTEANLGDGIADLPGILQASGPQLCLGSDSNARISMLEEMRWTEYVQRLHREQRGVGVMATGDDKGRWAPRLLEAATVGGARALRLEAGRIEAGALADFVTIDLDHPQLAHTTPETLADALVCGGGDGVIDGVCVGGRWIDRP